MVAALTAESLDAVAECDALVIADAAEADLSAIVALDERITGIARRDFWNHIDAQRSSGATLTVLVAKKHGPAGDAIVGYAMGEVRAWPVRAPACGWIYAIGVDKGHRLQRAASALMAGMIARFQA